MVFVVLFLDTCNLNNFHTYERVRAVVQLRQILYASILVRIFVKRNNIIRFLLRSKTIVRFKVIRTTELTLKPARIALSQLWLLLLRTIGILRKRYESTMIEKKKQCILLNDEIWPQLLPESLARSSLQFLTPCFCHSSKYYFSTPRRCNQV